jgi:hypothetical protein
MGMSSKPNSANPIGMFGTGLKYSIATLVRLGCEPEVWIGRDRHVFMKTPDTFRGKDFELLSMRSMRWGLASWRTTKLPFTTTYGRNWEPWMVFRELESNTRDEDGETIYSEHQTVQIEGEDDTTMIVVDLPAFIDAWRERDKVFLPNASRGGDMTVEVLPGPSDYLYWRGMRVYKLAKPSLLTWNIISYVVLTEDRTLAHEYYARSIIGSYVVKCNSDAVIEKVLTAPEKFWECGMEFIGHGEPGDGFRRIMARIPARVGASAWNYYAAYDTRVTAESYQLEDHHPLPWAVRDDRIVDKNGRDVLSKPYEYVGKWNLLAGVLVRRLNMESDPAQGEDELEPVGDET